MIGNVFVPPDCGNRVENFSGGFFIMKQAEMFENDVVYWQVEEGGR